MQESRPKQFFTLILESVSRWQNSRAPLLSAALAYYMVFSLSPLLLLSVSIASILYGPEAATGQLVGQINDYLGEEAATIIQKILAAGNQNSTNLLASVISTGVLLFGASLVFRQLKVVINMVWGTVPSPAPGFSGLLNTVKTFAFSLLLAMSVGLLLLLSLTLSTVLAALDTRILSQWPELANLLNWAEIIVLWLMPAVLFTVIFKVLPDATVAWRDVLPGAGVTTVLFAVGARLVALYLRFATLSSPQAAAGTLVVVLLWLYYSAQIFLLGAAFTRVFADHRGSPVIPAPPAASTTTEE
jgi:membrane protein